MLLFEVDVCRNESWLTIWLGRWKPLQEGIKRTQCEHTVLSVPITVFILRLLHSTLEAWPAAFSFSLIKVVFRK